MTAKRTRLKAGDVLELRAGDRFAYLHYLGKHQKYGDAVLVSPRLQGQLADVTSENFADGYVTFYPAALAANQGLVEVVGNLPPPAVPTRLRRPGAMSGNRVDTWVIENGDQQTVTGKLSEEELRLPFASIWNHEFLVQRIAMEWTPVNYLGAA